MRFFAISSANNHCLWSLAGAILSLFQHVICIRMGCERMCKNNNVYGKTIYIYIYIYIYSESAPPSSADPKYSHSLTYIAIMESLTHMYIYIYIYYNYKIPRVPPSSADPIRYRVMLTFAFHANHRILMFICFMRFIADWLLLQAIARRDSFFSFPNVLFLSTLDRRDIVTCARFVVRRLIF